jgi:hypothetical protein
VKEFQSFQIVTAFSSSYSVPHTLNDDQHTVIGKMAASMLSILKPLTARACSCLLAGDTSWFYFSYDCEAKWALARDPSMTKPKTLFKTVIIMVLVIWDVRGPALVEILPSNLRVSAKYLCKFAIRHMKSNAKTHCPKQDLKRITLHSDNVPSHRAKVTITKISELGMNQMSHSPIFKALPK